MIQVREILLGAYRAAGLIADGKPLDGTQSVTAEGLLNNIISGLNLQNFFASTMVQLEHQVVASAQSYTIGEDDGSVGTPADITAQRPASIRRIYYRFNAQAAPIELTIVGPQDIYSFRVAASAVGTPRYAAYLSDYPYGKIELNIQPQVGSSLIVVYNKAIPKAVITGTLPLPDEYEWALTCGLAAAAARRYGRPPEVVADMDQMKSEAYKQIMDNTQRSTPVTAHLDANEGSGLNSIWMLGSIY